MKREKRLTRRERKAVSPAGSTHQHGEQHIHCVACGKHLDTAGEARDRAARGLKSNLWMSIRCAHGSEFYACMGCLEKARTILDEHDRTGNAPRAAAAWH